jgi:hypothetical protein
MDELPTIAKDTSTRFHPELDFDRWREQFRWLYSFHEKVMSTGPTWRPSMVFRVVCRPSIRTRVGRFG